MTARPHPGSPAAALAPFGLALLILPVILIGGVTLNSMAGGADTALSEPADVLRRAGYPWAVTLHILAGTAMLMLGIVQVTPALRRRYPLWPRGSGRARVAGGIAFGLTALGMNANPAAKADSLACDTAQVPAALALIGCLGLGLRAARQRRFARHRVWMLRAYALSLGTATQTVPLFPAFLIVGPLDGFISETVFIGSWALNLAVAETLLRKPVQ